MIDPALDVLVAAGDPARLDGLSRTVFAIALQDHRPVTIHVVCRGFEPGALDAVRRRLAPLMTIAGDAALEIVDGAVAAGRDVGCGRYAAFVEAGNLVYPEAYRLLIAELVATGAAIAFGGILDAHVCRDGIVPITTAKRRAIQAGGVEGVLRNGVVPLHRFVLDRRRIASEDMVIGWPDAEGLGQICAHYPSSFGLEDMILGESVREDDA